MSAELLRALAPLAEADAEAPHAIAGRARSRVRRRRRLRLAGYVAACAAFLGVAGAVAVVGGTGSGTGGGTDGATASTGTGARVSEDQATLRGTEIIHAEELLRGAASRIRPADRTPARQPAVVCRGTTDQDRPKPCRALWVGDAPLLVLDQEETRLTFYMTEDTLRVDVRWALRNASSRSMLVDHGDLLVALVTDPDAVSTAAKIDDRTFRGDSLWADDRERIALDGERRSLERLYPGGTMRGWTTFSVPAAPASREALWDIATRAAAGTLTVQIGIPHERGVTQPSTALIAEASMPVGRIDQAIAADHLLTSFTTPRARGEEAGSGRQAALLCDVPRGMRSSTFENYSIPYQARQVPCAPGWVDGPVLADTGTAELRAGTPADTLVWDVTNVSGRTLQLSRLQLMIEPDPDGLRARGDGLTLLGTAAVTPSSAWLASGRRTAWLTNVFYDYPLHAGATLGGRDRLFPGMLSSGTIVDADAIVGSLADGGRATAIAAVPFLDDPSRVLLLETPLTLLIDPFASP
ncbi:hypothetical protein QQX09_13925 [Demequina sp. SYSU T00192]|uniref:Uncharacterized protein n=1 Tax=Demequina litoralis TaxID=3051660 RepID=A0ABT8GCT6_9MICO|nr:hypothetical protein [Demequina sp. SYSU T00192]MDN4476953.1 hypothetical protein [Demequina sp. SYSU T00192]